LEEKGNSKKGGEKTDQNANLGRKKEHRFVKPPPPQDIEDKEEENSAEEEKEEETPLEVEEENGPKAEIKEPNKILDFLPLPRAPGKDERKLIVLLENAYLESVKTGKDYELLNCDDHQSLIKKAKRDIAHVRPDITHQCLLTLLDSPLNKAGLLKVYIHTHKNVLIDVNPKIRIPRTFKRFSGLMVQLLHKFAVRATQGSETLMKVIKNPPEDHFPPNCKKIATEFNSKKTVEIQDYVKVNFKNEPVVFVLGAFAHGDLEAPFTVDELISFSHYPLSASVACGKVDTAFERLWGIF